MTVPASHLFADDFVAQRRAQLDAAKIATDRVDPGPAATRSETIYLTAADKDGNMISFINSLYDEFGSGVVVPGTGFALEDRGAGFTLQPGMANTVAPGKRPFHTLIPAFVTKDNEPYLSFGLMGGAMQAQGHVQVLLDLFVFHMGLQEGHRSAALAALPAASNSASRPHSPTPLATRSSRWDTSYCPTVCWLAHSGARR